MQKKRPEVRQTRGQVSHHDSPHHRAECSAGFRRRQCAPRAPPNPISPLNDYALFPG